MDGNKVDIATKYQVELNNKYSDYSKQGINKGNTTTESILKIVKQQANNNESE